MKFQTGHLSEGLQTVQKLLKYWARTCAARGMCPSHSNTLTKETPCRLKMAVDECMQIGAACDCSLWE